MSTLPNNAGLSRPGSYLPPPVKRSQRSDHPTFISFHWNQLNVRMRSCVTRTLVFKLIDMVRGGATRVCIFFLCRYFCDWLQHAAATRCWPGDVPAVQREKCGPATREPVICFESLHVYHVAQAEMLAQTPPLAADPEETSRLFRKNVAQPLASRWFALSLFARVSCGAGWMSQSTWRCRLGYVKLRLMESDKRRKGRL